MTASRFNTVGLMGTAERPGAGKVVPEICRILRSAGSEVLVLDRLAPALPGEKGHSMAALLQQIDLCVVVGGDGSLLSVAWPLAQAEVPVTGINLGRVGFLADISPEQSEQLIGCILSGDYMQEERVLLSAQPADSPLPACRSLNEVLVHSPSVANLSDFELQADGQPLYSIRADGIIVATSTGSTAYSLSAGGPILAPGLPGIAVVPMLAHSTGYGSVVLPVSTRLSIRAAQPTRLTADGREVIKLAPGQSLEVAVEPKRLKQLHPCGYDFFAAVRGKLGWGKQPSP